MMALIASAVTSLVPWAGVRTVFAGAIVALATMAFGAVWLAGEQYGASGRVAAVAECNAEWRVKYAEAQRQYANDMAEAHAAAAAVKPVFDGGDGALERLCEQSPTCRERQRKSVR